MTKSLRRRDFLSISAATAVTAMAGKGWTAEEKGKAKRPRVLLLGDSIRLSYQPAVAKKLAPVAEVVGPEENCRYALYTLSSLDRWIEQLGKPDIVHWNNGLHDVGHEVGRRPSQTPLETYVANLQSILRRLRAITPHVVWATITPVQPDGPACVSTWSFRNDEIDRYNKAALELMQKQAVPVDDLHAVVGAHRREYFAADQIHLNPAGQEACANAVVKAVARFL